MPAFRHKVTPTQGWQLTAYVRSLSGQAPFGAAPGREDHLKTSPAPSSLEQVTPTTSRP
jgi:cytochrome c oxidase cbb3-type subunit 3